jgi:hypothetical protein
MSEERRKIRRTLQKAGGLMSPTELAQATGKTLGAVKMLLGEMVKAGQVSNPAYGKYGRPDDTPYSPYPAYSANGDGGKSKDGKRSKRDAGAASVVCVHGLPGGDGCYPCDPEHPHRKEEGRGRGEA